MFSLSPIKILVVVAVILVLLGPDKLPEVANKLGRSWRALRRIQQRVEAEVRSAVPDLPSSAEIARIARSPVNLLNQLADRAGADEPLDEVEPEGPADAAREGPVDAAETPAAASDPAAAGLIAPTPRAEPPPADDRPFSDPALN